MPSDRTLLPCPFCGGQGYPDAELRKGCQPGESGAYSASIRCRSCAAEGPWAKADIPGDAVRLASRQWNERPVP